MCDRRMPISKNGVENDQSSLVVGFKIWRKRQEGELKMVQFSLGVIKMDVGC